MTNTTVLGYTTPPRRPHESQFASLAPTRSRVAWVVAVLLSGVITLSGQAWVGRLTIYTPAMAEARVRMHHAVLTNTLPEGAPTWQSVGANGMNARPLTVWAAEGLRRLIGGEVTRAYLIIETAALFVCCLLLFAFIRATSGLGYAFVALLSFGSVLPLSYLFHYFHPWDRPALAAWLAALLFTYQRQWFAVALVLFVGTLIKYDIIVFPILVLLTEWQRRAWLRTLWLPGALFALTGLTYIVLRWSIPGGFEPRPVVPQVLLNLQGMADYNLAYPPLLAFGVPAALAMIGWPVADRFARAAVLLGVFLVVIWFTQVNFVEVRTETSLLPLLLPAAICGFQRLVRIPGSAVTATRESARSHLTLAE